MKKLQIPLMVMLLLTSCHSKTEPQTPEKDYEGFIPKDSANKMITSYINSINYQQNDSSVRSITFSAKELRYYLDSMDNSDSIDKIEIKLAHKLSYINGGHGNQPASYNNNALTFIIGGLTINGTYIFSGNNVINRGTPCPTNCPSSISSPLFN